MKLSLYGHRTESDSHFRRFRDENVLTRLRALDARVSNEGLAALNPADDPLIAIGMEVDGNGRPTRNGYGVFNLAWKAAEHPEWADQVTTEIKEIRDRIRVAHGVPLRFLIWAGMGGSVEDKSMYEGAGLLRGRVRFYALDSTDPAKLHAILADIERRAGRPLREALRSTLVVGMALGMTSYEPVVNLEKLTALYDRQRVDGRANFLYLTLPGSLLDRFAGPRHYRNMPLQMDGRCTTAGRHSGPLTRGSLYPLALSGVDLRAWIAGTRLSDAEVMTAWKLASFLHAEGVAGRDKVTLGLPRAWAGASLWTKQDFEESLGKSEKLGIKIVIGEKPADAVRAASGPARDRAFLVVRFRGEPDRGTLSVLRRTGRPVAVLDVPRRAPLSRYMQFMHYAVFGLAYLRHMNFVTQPSVELYKSIANALHAEARRAGGPTRTAAWRAMCETPRQVTWRRCLTLYFDGVDAEGGTGDAARVYARLLQRVAADGVVEYGELTFFGDMRFSCSGRSMRKVLDRAADRVFRRGVNMPVDVYEGPAVNHSYHEMIIGHGRCFSTIVLSGRQHSIRAIGYGAEFHIAQFLATKLALARRRRPVVAVVLKDLSGASLEAADEFFLAAARYLRGSEGRA